jgi:hypothetical protein
MYAAVHLRTNKDEKSTYILSGDKLGYFTIEHNQGNTIAWLSFTWDNKGYSWESEQREHYGSNIRCGRLSYQFEGKKAIQKAIEFSRSIEISDLVNGILKYEFYNRSYMDYFLLAQERM